MRSRHSKYAARTPPKLTTDTIRDICLGQQDFGKATVNCCFLYRDSKWGSLSSTPVAILRLRLTFAKPLDYKLSSAEVELSFESMDVGVEPQSHAVPDVTKHVYPSMIHGPPTKQKKQTKREIKPHLDGFGFKAGSFKPFRG